MEDFKQVIKGIVCKFIDNKRRYSYSSVRMSEINISINSDILPLHCSTFNLTPNDVSDSKNAPTKQATNNDKINTNITTNTKTSKSSPKEDHRITNDAKNLKSENIRNALPKLKITNNNQNENSPVLTQQSPVGGNLSEVMITMQTKDACSPHTPSRQKKPIMGRTALLRRSNVERNDSKIIEEMVSGKYSPVTQALQNRMHRRRRMKHQDQSEDDYSDTVFSSPPNCSPLSTSTIDTVNSTPDEERNRFYFPSEGRNDLRFLKSTDDVNVDTTIEDLDASSLNSSAISHEKSSICSEYDAKIFLNNAIGELTNESVESGVVEESSNKKEVSTKSEENSVRTSEISSLLSRTNCLYSSIKSNIKKKCVKLQTISQNEKNTAEKRESVIFENSLLENLMRELSIQNEIMFQISKALDYCRTMKGFETTVEFIEAEKILLIASCTKAALTKEIENVEDDTFEKKDDARSCGQVHLNNFKFYPKKDEVKSGTPKESTDEQFVVILTCGSTVLASDVTLSDGNGVVHVEKSFEFKNLTPDFEILVCIYAMRVPNKSHHNQEQTNCPLPKKLFHTKIARKYKVTNETLYIKPSSFLLCGKCEIRSPNLTKINSNNDSPSPLTLKMYSTPISSSLSGMFSVTINSSVTLNNRISGFLTIGMENEHGCNLWNRRWCVLEGTVLKYWNYPSEEVTTPMGRLDLNNCMEQQICAVDRSLCARPKTLMVSVRYKEGSKNYLLSADNLGDMKQWEKEINYVLRTLSLWNCRCSKIP